MVRRPIDELKNLEICGCLGFVEVLLKSAAGAPADGPGTGAPAAIPDERLPDTEADINPRSCAQGPLPEKEARD
jgi:hypothetical protein